MPKNAQQLTTYLEKIMAELAEKDPKNPILENKKIDLLHEKFHILKQKACSLIAKIEKLAPGDNANINKTDTSQLIALLSYINSIILRLLCDYMIFLQIESKQSNFSLTITTLTGNFAALFFTNPQKLPNSDISEHEKISIKDAMKMLKDEEKLAKSLSPQARFRHVLHIGNRQIRHQIDYHNKRIRQEPPTKMAIAKNVTSFLSGIIPLASVLGDILNGVMYLNLQQAQNACDYLVLRADGLKAALEKISNNLHAKIAADLEQIEKNSIFYTQQQTQKATTKIIDGALKITNHILHDFKKSVSEQIALYASAKILEALYTLPQTNNPIVTETEIITHVEKALYTPNQNLVDRFADWALDSITVWDNKTNTTQKITFDSLICRPASKLRTSNTDIFFNPKRLEPKPLADSSMKLDAAF
jgi:hypothetical protein